MPASTYSGARGGQFEVSIGSLDDVTKTVYAQYRPKELQIDQSVPWSKHAASGMADQKQLEFTGAEGRTSTLELFFDASETPNSSVEQAIADLSYLASPTVLDSISPPPPGQDPQIKRPHHCVMVFGRLFNQNIYKCVIESLSTKITMFSPDGMAIRATVNVKLKEASRVSIGAQTGGNPATPSSPGSSAASGAGGNAGSGSSAP